MTNITIKKLETRIERMEKRLKKLSKLHLGSEMQINMIRKNRAKIKETQRLESF